MGATIYPVFTIGHSNHSIDAFIGLLRAQSILDVIDVRSSPYSKYVPHFNREALARALGDCQIGYLFLGGELGGRPLDYSCYGDDGKVNYDRLANTEWFDEGIRRIIWRADNGAVVLMCSEKEPLDCHRTILIANALAERGVNTTHILADDSLESHPDCMDRLMDNLKLPRTGDLFRSREDVVADALTLQAKKVAYVAEGRPTIGESEHGF